MTGEATINKRSRRLRRGLGSFLFKFVVIADTHVNQEEGQSSSPWPCNRFANARGRHVVQSINRLTPRFVIHLGDIVHPVPAQATYAPAAEAFHALAKQLNCRLYITPGNHDVGDKPVPWMPAGTVTDDYIALYERHFGKHFYAFDSNDCRFVVINAQIINSGLACEPVQKRWLEDDLARNSGKRIFLCTHYPPYVSDAAEAGGYDNIDEPGRSWLLDLIAHYKLEAVFAGHVHNLWYDVHGETECYILPSTAFVRQDYSELYKIEPGPENGRNDEAKLGFFVVDVHEHGHVAHLERTYGATLGPDETFETPCPRLGPVHTKTLARGAVGVDLREPWAETVEIAASGAVDEFERKFARNDYPLFALWEMGIRKLRIPMQDLCNARTRARMETLRSLGHEFTVYSYDVPTGSQRKVLIEHANLVSVLEIALASADFPDRLRKLGELKARSGLAVHMSKLRKHEDIKKDGSRYAHVINHGFLRDELDQADALLNRPEARGAIDGLVFRVGRARPLVEDFSRISEFANSHDVRASIHVRLASDNPAEVANDDLGNANRVAETLVASLAVDRIDVFLDTFADVDRGFFARSGLVDRRYNPRPAGRVFRSIQSIAANASDAFRAVSDVDDGGARIIAVRGPRELWFLVLPRSAISFGKLEAPGLGAAAGEGRWIALSEGEIHSVRWSAVTVGAGNFIQLDAPVRCSGPSLFCIPLASGHEDTV